MKKNNNKGFTLVELLVVIAIIGILCVLAIPSLLQAISKAKAADIEADISAVRTAALVEYAENSTKNLVDKGNVTTKAYEKSMAKTNNPTIEQLFGISGIGDNAIYGLKREIGTDGYPKYVLRIVTPSNKIAEIVESNLNGLGKIDATDKNIITVELIK